MHWITKPTKNHIDRPSKPSEQNVIDVAADVLTSDRMTDSAIDRGNRHSAGDIGTTDRLHIPDAEATAREYCRRRNAGKWGLRKV